MQQKFVCLANSNFMFHHLPAIHTQSTEYFVHFLTCDTLPIETQLLLGGRSWQSPSTPAVTTDGACSSIALETKRADN